MVNFPMPYKEELVYSVVARAGVRHGLLSPKQLLDEVFKSRGVVATIDLPCRLQAIAKSLPAAYGAAELIERHTLFPIYAPFIPEHRRRQCLKLMQGQSSGSIHTLLGVSASRTKNPQFLRYCPGCLRDQLMEHGEYYWQRAWQVTGVEVCLQHGLLANTDLGRPLMQRHRFIAPSPENCRMIEQGAANALQNKITYQVQQLLLLKLQRSPSLDQWTSYYRNLASWLDLRRGKTQIDHQSIRHRVLHTWSAPCLAKYNLVPSATDQDESDWLQTIFRKHRKTFSFLQHFIVHQSLLGDQWGIEQVIEDVSCYEIQRVKAKPTVSANIGAFLTLDQRDWLRCISVNRPKQARTLSPSLYARLYRACPEWLKTVNRQAIVVNVNKCVNRVDWDRRDRDCLKSLMQLSLIFATDRSGPRRSRAHYLKMHGNPSTLEKALNRMPLSLKFLIDHAETVAYHQVRRLENSYEILKTRFSIPPKWRLLRQANLREASLTELAKERVCQLIG